MAKKYENEDARLDNCPECGSKDVEIFIFQGLGFCGNCFVVYELKKESNEEYLKRISEVK